MLYALGRTLGQTTAEKFSAGMESSPQRLKPNSFQSSYVRPEGRTLQVDEFSAACKARTQTPASCGNQVQAQEKRIQAIDNEGVCVASSTTRTVVVRGFRVERGGRRLYSRDAGCQAQQRHGISGCQRETLQG
jgi:hypothetical protein